MMKKIYFIFLFCAVFCNNSSLTAQCPTGRYLYPSYFTGYTITTDTYSTANSTSLLVDIYQPAGDTLTERPLIILAHGGSFIGGSRNNDVTVDSLCVHFSLRGYVTASIDYRLGNPFTMLTDSTAAIDEVMKAISDGKAAVRYFVKDRATANKYKIDTNNIYIGGNSAGAVLYLNAGYIDSMGECPADLQGAMLANGGFEGNSGNAGYTTKFRGIINLAGGLNEVSFVGMGDKPSVNAQGDADSVVPYTCGHPAVAPGINFGVTLCGLGSLEPRYDSIGIPHISHVFPGQGHVPWTTDTAMFTTVDSMVQVFLYNLVCLSLSAPSVPNVTASVSIFPNPVSNGSFTIQSNIGIKDVELFDQLGRVIHQSEPQGKHVETMNTANIPRGFYLVGITLDDGKATKLFRKVVVE